MEQNTTIFETGATSAAVNELILYTDNTRELVELRDEIYKDFIHWRKSPMAMNLIPLLNKAQNNYAQEMGKEWWSTAIEDQEYCQIYANRFSEWKKERERNQSQLKLCKMNTTTLLNKQQRLESLVESMSNFKNEGSERGKQMYEEYKEQAGKLIEELRGEGVDESTHPVFANAVTSYNYWS
jgi:hypothetical protein